MRHFPISRAFSILLMAAAAAPLSAAPPVFDQLLLQDGAALFRGVLPSGPAGPALAIGGNITALVVLPSGRMLATTVESARSHLKELRPDGSLRPLAPIAAPESCVADAARDLALDQNGRLFALVFTTFAMAPPQTRLVQLDPATGEYLGAAPFPYPHLTSIATAPDGLWGSDGYHLWKLDADRSRAASFSPIGAPDQEVTDIESDSAGRVWYAYRGYHLPNAQGLGWLDPWSGEAGSAAPALTAQTPEIDSIAIDRRCYESSTVRCLQNGRFRAEIAWQDYQGNSGDATVARTRSRDTGVFYFFDRSNWELMVKVLDGCGLNSHFWVYSSASTDVAYTMTVTDKQTGAQQVYRNSLGNIARTVTDNLAFACTP